MNVTMQGINQAAPANVTDGRISKSGQLPQAICGGL